MLKPAIILLFSCSISVMAFWGETITLALLLTHIDLRLFPMILVADGAIRGVGSYLAIPFRQKLGVLLGGSGMVAICCILVGTAFGDVRYVVFFVIHRNLTETFQQYALLHVYATHHRREDFVKLIIVGRATAALIGLLIIPFSFLTTRLIGLWSVSIGASLVSLGGLSLISQRNLTEGPHDVTGFREMRILTQAGLIRWLTLSAVSVIFLTNLLLYKNLTVLERSISEVTTFIVFFSVVGAIGTWLTLPIGYWMFSGLLRQFNAGTLAWVYPSLLNIAFVNLAVLPTIPTAIFGEMTRGPLRSSSYEPIERLLYHGLPSGAELQIRRLIQHFVEPFAHIGAGLILGLILATSRPTLWFAMITLGVGLFFLIAARRSGFLYGQMLATSLSVGQYRVLRQASGEWELSDQTYTTQLIERLSNESVDLREKLLIAEVIANSQVEEGYGSVKNLWENTPPNLQAELLPLIINGWPDNIEENRHLIEEALVSEIPHLRREALSLMASYAELDPTYEIARYLIVPDSEANVIAATALLKHRSVKMQNAARAQLRWLAKDQQVNVRVMAVTALVKDSLNVFGEVTKALDIRPYLHDAAPRVRVAVLAAATMTQLLQAAQDISEEVQRAAAIQMRERRFQGSKRQLTQKISETWQAIQITGSTQIEANLCYWRLLIALAVISRRAGAKRLMRVLNQGFEYLAVLETMCFTLRQLDFLPMGGLIQQLERDHAELLSAMVNYLGVLVGRERVQAIMWALGNKPNTEAYKIAIRALQNLTNRQFAERFEQALHGQVAQVTTRQSVLPHVVFRTLLAQTDEWRPLLTLHILSQAPEAIRHQWCDGETARQILDTCMQSNSDFIREAARLIQRELDSTNEKETTMLSTLERMLFLRNVSYLQSLRLDQLRALARGCEEVTATEGQMIIRQGDMGDGLYIVVEGQVRIERLSADGTTQVVICEMGSSEVFGEISLLDGGVRTANVIAASPSVLLLTIHRQALHAALEDDPNIAMTMLKTMAQSLRRTTEMVETFVVKQDENTPSE